MGANPERATIAAIAENHGEPASEHAATKNPNTNENARFKSKSAENARIKSSTNNKVLNDRTNRPPASSPLAATFSPDGHLTLQPREHAIRQELQAALKAALKENRELVAGMQAAAEREGEMRRELGELRVIRMLYDNAVSVPVSVCDRSVSVGDDATVGQVTRWVETQSE